ASSGEGKELKKRLRPSQGALTPSTFGLSTSTLQPTAILCIHYNSKSPCAALDTKGVQVALADANRWFAGLDIAKTIFDLEDFE
ncbi:hypothetical protein WG66_004008, partial [Moniliophthora roreri]